jgi:hypothetical protein
MPFTVQDLLLTEERKTQLTAALANLGVADPLGKIVGEASADVARLTRGYVIEESSVNGWIRVLALERAYLVAELGVPEDMATAADAAREELAAIASGRRPNLQLAAAPSTAPVSSGSWGSSPKVPIRL